MTDSQVGHRSSVFLPSPAWKHSRGWIDSRRRIMCHATRACSTMFAILLLSMPSARAVERSISVEAKLGQTVMKSGETQHNYVRIGINGCEQEKTQRPPVNVSFVIDRSGSMQGQRIAQAQEAAISAIKRLDRNDTASVVIFDH